MTKVGIVEIVKWDRKYWKNRRAKSKVFPDKNIVKLYSKGIVVWNKEKRLKGAKEHYLKIKTCKIA